MVNGSKLSARRAIHRRLQTPRRILQFTYLRFLTMSVTLLAPGADCSLQFQAIWLYCTISVYMHVTYMYDTQNNYAVHICALFEIVTRCGSVISLMPCVRRVAGSNPPQPPPNPFTPIFLYP